MENKHSSTAPAPPLLAYAGTLMKHTHAGPSVIDVLCDYIESLHGKPSQATARYALSIWSKFGPVGDLVYLSEFTPAMQAKFVTWCRKRRLNTGKVMSNGTINRYLDILRSATRLAQRNGTLAFLPHIQLLPKPQPRDRFLSQEELDRLVAACHEEHLRRFVILSVCTLQRVTAVLRLRIEQVDLEWNRINFMPANSVQSNKRRPTVPIPSILRPHLQEWMQSSQSGYVIERHGQSIQRIRRAFAAACEEAELQDVTPGVLRHTGATLLAAAGVPIREISGMLGHTTSRITEEVYAKRRPEFLGQAVGAIDALFGTAISKPSTQNDSARQCAPNARQSELSATQSSSPEIIRWSIAPITQPTPSLQKNQVPAMA